MNVAVEAPKRCLCICQKYCNSRPHIISEASFYRHLNEVERDSDEYRKILTFKTLSIEAANTLLARNIVLEQQAGPSTALRVSQHARRLETQRAIAKRAREQPDPRAGKRKCTRKAKASVSDS